MQARNTAPPRDERTRSVVEKRRRSPLPARVRLPDGSLFPLDPTRDESYVLGAGSEADIVVDEATVSRRHLELQVVPEGVLVRDLGSRNGTFYLGQQVREMVVALGGSLRVGRAELTLEPDPNAFPMNEGPERYGDLVAESSEMRRLFALLERLEGSLVNVLIEGESGTGKELFARAIHEHSSVRQGPLIALNCGAIGRELVRSELFGHRKGAFTGAIESRLGAFEAADGGTLFLDEIGELPLDVQPMLLRALEERAITRLGENNRRPVRVRVIAATNRNLEERVAQEQFREDLYYRLMVVRLALPPLRERPEDIPLLASLFAQRAGAHELPASVLEQLREHPWPGNVRELRHCVESYLAIGVLPFRDRRPLASIEHALAPFIDVSRPHRELKEEFMEAFLRTYLARLLAHTEGNVSEAARQSGIERSYLSKLIHRHGLRS